MAFELKPGQGTLHKNDKEGVETRPDYTGQLNIDGTIFRVSGWIKEGKSGKWMSLNCELPRAKAALETQAKPAKPVEPDDDSDPPF